jgi:hypothetical protein
MIWVAVWAVLVLAAATVFFLLGRDLWRKAKALTRELATATDRFAEIADRLDDLDPPTRDDLPVVRSTGTSRPLQR